MYMNHPPWCTAVGGKADKGAAFCLVETVDRATLGLQTGMESPLR